MTIKCNNCHMEISLTEAFSLPLDGGDYRGYIPKNRNIHVQLNPEIPKKCHKCREDSKNA